MLEKSDNNRRICHSSYDGNLVTSSFIHFLWRGSSNTWCGFVILTSSCLGAYSFHSYAFFAEVSSQSGIMDLLHVLLYFSLGTFQKVSLALDLRKVKRKGEIRQSGEN